MHRISTFQFAVTFLLLCSNNLPETKQTGAYLPTCFNILGISYKIISVEREREGGGVIYLSVRPDKEEPATNPKKYFHFCYFRPAQVCQDNSDVKRGGFCR